MPDKKTGGEGAGAVNNKHAREIDLGEVEGKSAAFGNTMHHVLAGDFPDGLVYSKMEIHVSEYGFKIKFLSLQDGCLLKEFDVLTAGVSVIELEGVVASYRLDFMGL